MRDLNRIKSLHHLSECHVHLRLTRGLKGGFLWRIDKVFDLRADVVKSRGKARIDGRNEIHGYPQHNKDGNQQFEIQTISFLHGRDYKTNRL